jgi:hypothetical protein
MVNVILELTFIDNLVNFLTHALNSAIRTNLTNDVLAVSALSELKILLNWLGGIGNDVLDVEWSQLVPFLLDSLHSLSGLLLIITVVHHCHRLIIHVRRFTVLS